MIMSGRDARGPEDYEVKRLGRRPAWNQLIIE
jgi:hypothetical protein